MHPVPRFLALTVPLVALAATATEYFVAPNGNDADPGTREQPWLTTGKANATLQPGDTATFPDGTYPGVIEPAASGTEAAPITYRAATPRAVVLSGGKASSGKDLCVFLKGRSHIVLSGFQLLPERGGWFLWEGTSHCVMRDSHMEKATGQWAPAHLQDCHYNRFENLEAWRAISVDANGHVGGNMFQLFASTHNVLQNNLFADNDPDGDGVQLSMAGNIAIDNRFHANLLFGGRPGMATIRYAWPAAATDTGVRSALRTPDQANTLLPDQFAANLDGAPQFADLAADDYRLQPGSPAIDTGRPRYCRKVTGPDPRIAQVEK
ncbi:MAG: hypothetical protein A3K19_32780 [Lentisphaerae bacterium RIFOXYB12_FULL_65_16]|nr:MAG: hypothetical protein A3K18_28135 [Lentisphaerae bacterium RIFOXYA12_64_32]OGV84519.1 MAG: hypothetical protein A3K19_32780 [Lentisphaerae bacterium RIFOXYB12_FULL_65_16]